jgi:hypothetical protein
MTISPENAVVVVVVVVVVRYDLTADIVYFQRAEANVLRITGGFKYARDTNNSEQLKPRIYDEPTIDHCHQTVYYTIQRS